MKTTVNEKERCDVCGGKLPPMGSPRYVKSMRSRQREGCRGDKAKVADKDVDVCGAYDPFLSDGETRYMRYIGDKCHDPRHDEPCPAPCPACYDECEGPLVRYFDMTGIEIINRDGSPTTKSAKKTSPT